MKVSIITPTYNSQATIGDTVKSVVAQSHADIEHIIVDGASQDQTLQLAKSFGHTGPFICEKDMGIYDAMNKGIQMATGDIIGILNSDDFYSHTHAIDHVVHTFKKHNKDSVYSDLLYVDTEDTSKVLRTWVAGKFHRRHFLRGWMPPHPTFFVRREVYQKFGDFNLDLKSSADYELLLRLLFVHKISVEYLPGILVHMRAGGQSNRSVFNRLAAHREDYHAWKLNGLSPKWYTLLMKPTRKIQQFMVKSSSVLSMPTQSPAN
ncbi:MAG: glycosyltransferase [Chitinophagaceae bacterium]|nr:glycosyltransferase [Chitinophagaceae bacterium]